MRIEQKFRDIDPDVISRDFARNMANRRRGGNSQEAFVSAIIFVVAISVALLVAIFVNGCPQPEPKPQPQPQPQPQPGPVDASNATPCGDACANLAKLGCKEALPTKEGTTCEVVCQLAVDEGHPLNTTCVANIKTCDELNTVCR